MKTCSSLVAGRGISLSRGERAPAQSRGVRSPSAPAPDYIPAPPEPDPGTATQNIFCGDIIIIALYYFRRNSKKFITRDEFRVPCHK